VQALNPYLGKLLALFIHLLAEEKCSALFEDSVSDAWWMAEYVSASSSLHSACAGHSNGQAAAIHGAKGGDLACIRLALASSVLWLCMHPQVRAQMVAVIQQMSSQYKTEVMQMVAALPPQHQAWLQTNVQM
jgi:hypothetical protein